VSICQSVPLSFRSVQSNYTGSWATCGLWTEGRRAFLVLTSFLNIVCELHELS